MAGEQVLDLPRFVWVIKIVQAFFAVLLLALAAYLESVISWAADGMLIWTALYTIIILVYYFVSIHFAPQLYNWIAVLVLESFAVLWWLVSWALLAATLGGSFAANSSSSYYYDYGYWWKSKRDLAKRTTYNTFGSVIIASLTFSLITWILYCITLTFIVLAVVKHQKRSAPAQPAGAQVKEATQMEAAPQQQTV